MKKITILSLMMVFLILIVIAVLISIFSFKTDAHISNNRMWTKAICNEENYCIDIQITCEGNKIVDIKPIPEGIYFSREWKDTRSEEFRNKLC